MYNLLTAETGTSWAFYVIIGVMLVLGTALYFVLKKRNIDQLLSS